MLDFYIKKYKRISELTYYSFEIYHYRAISQFIGKYLAIHDLHFLLLIDSSQGEITPGTLARTFFLNNNTVSNRLKSLEEDGYITISKSKEDSRKRNIEITEKSRSIIALYSKYLDGMLDYIRRSFSPFEYRGVVNAFGKLNKLVEIKKISSSGTSSSSKPRNRFSSLFFVELNNYFYSFEQEFIEEKKIALKQRDLFTITEFYLYVKEGNTNVLAFSKYLNTPYQSIVTKINRFISQGYLTKDKNSYAFSPETECTIEMYMNLRTLVYYDTMSNLSEKDQKIVKKVFECLKEYSLISQQKYGDK